jgi:hypothetical protein
MKGSAMSFNESVKIISEWADRFNNGDFMEALYDMHTVQDYLSNREITAFRNYMETNRVTFAGV